MQWMDIDRDRFARLLGKRMRSAMVRGGLTPWQVAKEVGVDTEALVSWLYGKGKPDAYQLYRLARTLGLGILPITK